MVNNDITLLTIGEPSEGIGLWSPTPFETMARMVNRKSTKHPYLMKRLIGSFLLGSVVFRVVLT
ncbi:hypothetical protein OH492_19160 [Vibrio chagasii]|nr:hypothetical protein [Vibrio chagasii]